jgi:hypothetical protein
MAAMNGGNKGNMDGDEQSHFQPRPPVQMSDFNHWPSDHLLQVN